MAHQRRPHQKRAVSDVLAGFQKNDRGQLVMACGTGKTVVSLWVKEDLRAQRTLVLVPSIALVDQFASEWRKHAAPDQQYAALCVCSDSTVGQSAEDDYDSLHFTADDLVQDDFDVTSDPGRIAAFLRQPGRRVVFSTYQSSHLIAEAQIDELVPAFDLAVADEAHRCAGDGNSVFATILDGERIRAARRLFATATPRIYRLRKGQEEAATMLVDMSNEALFGPRFHTLTFGEAIRQDLLSDYRVVIMLVDDPEIHSVLKSSNDKHRALRAAQVGLLKAIREFNLQRVISFHNYVENANGFAQDLRNVASAMWADDPQTGWPVADVVSGKMSAQVRKEKLEAFRRSNEGQARILTNARCLTEGVDVPDLDGVAFIDPRGSHIDIMQALGRAIRKHDNKSYGTVILPVFLGKGNTPIEVVENSNFKPVWDVLNALRAHDADFETALRIRRQIDGGGADLAGVNPFAKIHVLGARDVVALAKVIQPKIIQELTDSWEVGFGATRAYYVTYGHCNTKFATMWPEGDSTGFPLGRWLDKQRVAYREGRLSMERIERLKSLDIVWYPQDRTWMLGFQCAQAYAEKHGHCNADWQAVWPEGDPTGFQLGRWLTTQRQKFKGQTESQLSREQIFLLESIGICWSPRQAKWENGYSCAREYADLHGHCNAPRGATWPENDPGGFQLGSWIIQQRRAYFHKSPKHGRLSDEQVQRLEAVKIKWDWSLQDYFSNKATQGDNGFVAISLDDLADRLKDEDPARDQLPELMAHFGCDLEQSRALLEAGSYDKALELLEEATGTPLRLKMR